MLIDTSLQSNFVGIFLMKKEALESAIFETFLESAPQLILQASISLFIGFQSKYAPSNFFTMKYISYKFLRNYYFVEQVIFLPFILRRLYYIWSVFKASNPFGPILSEYWVARVKLNRWDVQSDGLLLSSDNEYKQYKCFRERVWYYSIW